MNFTLPLFLRKAKAWSLPYYFIIICLIFIVVKYLPTIYEDDDPEHWFVPKHLQKYLRPIENFTNNHNISALTMRLERLNDNLEVLNWERYGVVDSDTTVFLVQVDRDVERLQLLIISLAQVQNVQTILLIFSHSFYDSSINELIKSISFCKVAQIFYPFSLQLFPGKFPGVDPDDCKPDSNKKNCFNRDAHVTVHKQHWWWMANMVFRQMPWSQTHKSSVVFLQENDYVLPDILHMLKYAQRSLTTIPEVEVMAFGRPPAKNLDYDLLTLDSWRPTFDRGLAFNMTTWKKIVSLTMSFCTYDDSSWSYSLLHLFDKFPRGHVDMVACMAPRVISTGIFSSRIIAMENIQQGLGKANLFPEKVKAVALYDQQGRVNRRSKPPPHGNGGWSDERDHLLCLDPLVSTVTEDLHHHDETTTPPIFTFALMTYLLF